MQAKIARSSRFPVTSSAEGESKIIDQRTARRGDERERDHGQQNEYHTVILHQAVCTIPYFSSRSDIRGPLLRFTYFTSSHRIQSDGKSMTALFRTPIITAGLFFLGALMCSVSGLALSVYRRSFITSAFATCAVPTIAHAAGPCASGVGDGCADLAEGNSLIRELQERSAANKERNEKVRTSHQQEQSSSFTVTTDRRRDQTRTMFLISGPRCFFLSGSTRCLLHEELP